MKDKFGFIYKYIITAAAFVSFGLLLLVLQKIFFKNEDFLIIEGKYGEALNKLLTVTRNKQNKWKYHLRIAYCYYMLGEFSQAIEYFEKVITLNRKNLISYLYLSILYTERNNFDRALFYYDNVISFLQKSGNKNKLKNFEINDVKGWICYKQGEKEKAIEFYTHVIKDSSKQLKLSKRKKCIVGTPLFLRFGQIYLKRNTPMFYRFGIIYLAQGKKQEAKEQFERAIKYGGPENIFTKKSKEELEKLR